MRRHNTFSEANKKKEERKKMQFSNSLHFVYWTNGQNTIRSALHVLRFCKMPSVMGAGGSYGSSLSTPNFYFHFLKSNTFWQVYFSETFFINAYVFDIPPVSMLIKFTTQKKNKRELNLEMTRTGEKEFKWQTRLVMTLKDYVISYLQRVKLKQAQCRPDYALTFFLLFFSFYIPSERDSEMF